MSRRRFNHFTGQIETIAESGSELQYLESRERFFQLKEELLVYINQGKTPKDYKSKLKELMQLQNELWPE